MADPDGTPANSNDPAEALSPPARPVAPAPRVNPPNINSAKEAPPVGGPPGFNDFLEWMRAQSGGAPAAGSSAQRGPLPKEKKKFQRRDADARADSPADPTAEASEPPSGEPATPEVRTPPVIVAAPAGADAGRPVQAPLPSPEPLTGRVRRQGAPAKRNSWLGLATQLGVLALLAASFVLGRATAPKAVVSRPAAPAAPEIVNAEGKLTTQVLSDANAALIDQAMAAEQDSRFKEADELLNKVKASGQHVPGLSYQLAQLALFSKDPHRAIPFLNESLVQGENLGDVYNMHATLPGTIGLVRGVNMNDYETATKVDPFNARHFFFWGEALRRAGKDQAALVRLQEAIDRLREPELESLYRLKLRLAKIEAGQEKDFADELARRLAMPSPEMDWLITAAAVEMHRGKFADAAGFLERAAQRGDGETFASRLRDYYLFQFQYEKELQRFYQKTPAPVPGGKADTRDPGASPAPSVAGSPAIGLDVPPLPPPASPGVTVPR